MEKVQIRRQYRFDDGQLRDLRKQGKDPKFDWDLSPIEQATDDQGQVQDGIYEVKCRNTGARKAVVYATVEVPESVEELSTIDQDYVLKV